MHNDLRRCIYISVNANHDKCCVMGVIKMLLGGSLVLWWSAIGIYMKHALRCLKQTRNARGGKSLCLPAYLHRWCWAVLWIQNTVWMMEMNGVIVRAYKCCCLLEFLLDSELIAVTAFLLSAVDSSGMQTSVTFPADLLITIILLCQFSEGRFDHTSSQSQY